jgi:hypothetical protein
MNGEQQSGLILTLTNGAQHPLKFETTADAQAAIDDFIDGGSRLGRDWIRADDRTAVARAHIISVTVVEDLARETPGGRYAGGLKAGRNHRRP